ncbi:MFS general substrate transporter [Cucurbitaria berberidis CBS 394.84]|uniref:Lysosomal dipeptide transporter MFSD1 n=1 Tax=Cucurbitaria berberidis CBS 394.84 TaxID=1168544 RepID=A0A9P4GP47_9PLEO|nr:MFS general substrate transporter [Cucurbitaria berberidis CBS 394.84]KAF1850068.1 MFS general substrate transporter [Cucurbitaria berberidis CBS 394.84]
MERTRDNVTNNELGQSPSSEAKAANVVVVSGGESSSERSVEGRSADVPLKLKLIAVLLVTAIGFGSHWSSGVTGAMKSTLKKKLHINNAQYAVLEASEDFMKTALILVSGLVTDRIGGASAMLWGNAIFSVGAIFIAAATTVRSYKFMIFGVVVQAFGDIATQVAQYKIFSSWFAPSNGFASTLGFELGIGKIGAFVGKSTANVIAKKTGDFSWVYWTAVFMNLFTNAVTVVFWLFTKWCGKKYSGTADPATGEKLTESNKKFEVGKVLRLPWPFWGVVGFSLFQTSAAVVYSQNATEMAEKRFNISAVKAGWYSAMSQYLGFFLVPLIGIFVDLLGNRITLMLVCGMGMLLAMCLAEWGPTVSGTAASFGIFGVASMFGPTVIIDAIRTSMWYQEVFGSGYAVKIAVNNSMNIIIRIVTGVIQDRDNDSYDNVVIVYVVLAAGSVVVAAAMLACSFMTVDVKHLQWTRKQRIAKGHLINESREKFENGIQGQRNRKISLTLFVALLFLILGAWAAYFWGVATGNNK